jgi:hypothetical protein
MHILIPILEIKSLRQREREREENFIFVEQLYILDTRHIDLYFILPTIQKDISSILQMGEEPET